MTRSAFLAYPSRPFLRALTLAAILAGVASTSTGFAQTAAAPPTAAAPSAAAAPPPASSAQPAPAAQPGGSPARPASAAPAPGPRRPRTYEQCTRDAMTRKYRGAERRHFVFRCQLGYGRRLFRRRGPTQT